MYVCVIVGVVHGDPFSHNAALLLLAARLLLLRIALLVVQLLGAGCRRRASGVLAQTRRPMRQPLAQSLQAGHLVAAVVHQLHGDLVARLPALLLHHDARWWLVRSARVH